MTMQEVSDYLNNKIAESENFIRITFYELRVKYNLSDEETQFFLKITKNKFENNGYKVYFTNDEYEFNNIKYTVQQNELMIAIKNETNQ